jgi:hypothetical protein
MSGWLGAANYGVIQANKLDAYLLAQRTGAGTVTGTGAGTLPEATR